MLHPSHLRRLAVLSLAVIAGCSASKYDQDYKARIAAFRGDAVFADFDPKPRELADGRVLVHLPLKFAAADDDSRQPSLLFLRPLEEAAVFTAELSANNVTRRPVLVVAAVPTARRKPDALKQEVAGWVSADGAFKQPKWERRTIAPAKGGPAEWDVISLDGEQAFETVVQGGPNGPEIQDQKAKGFGELWISTAADRDFCVLVAVRVPEELVGQFRYTPAQLADLIARRVEILPPPADEAAAAN